MNAEEVFLLAAPLAAFASSLLGTRWLVSHAGRFRKAMDVPNARSLHVTPVPRTGGLAILLGIVAAAVPETLFGMPAGLLPWFGGAIALVAGISFADDLGEMPRRMRLIAHLLAGVLLVFAGLRWSTLDLPGLALHLPFALSVVLTLLYTAWMINLYNFMDGMDGFAGGMAVSGFGALAILGWIGGEPAYGSACAIIVLAALGFLPLNFPPARIFLGDVGSSTLGLLAAGFSLWGTSLSLFPLWVAWLAFSPFIVDATWTLIARLVRGEKIWEAHRSHHYQRLVLAGWSHRRTVLRAYLVMAAAAATAVAAPRLPAQDQWLILTAWAAIYLMIHVKVLLVERMSAEQVK